MNEFEFHTVEVVADGPGDYKRWVMVPDEKRTHGVGLTNITFVGGQTLVVGAAGCAVIDGAFHEKTWKDRGIKRFAHSIRAIDVHSVVYVLKHDRLRKRICTEIWARIDSVARDVLTESIGETRRGFESLVDLIPKESRDLPYVGALVRAVDECDPDGRSDEESWCDTFLPLLEKISDEVSLHIEIGPLRRLLYLLSKRLLDADETFDGDSPWELLSSFDALTWSEKEWSESLRQMPRELADILDKCDANHEVDDLFVPSSAVERYYRLLTAFNKKLCESNHFVS